MKRFLAILFACLPALADVETLMVPTGLTWVEGDILFFNGTNWVSLARGTNGQFLTMGTVRPTWATSSGGGGGGSGTVTSVALTAPLFQSVSGSPITTSGTLALSWSNQAANTVLAGPTTGADAAPTFRSLVDADVPNTITIDLATTSTTANSGDSATAFFTTGQIERSRGGTGADTSAYGAGLIGSDGSNNTIDVDTESELETALGSVDIVTVTTDDISSANLRTLLSDESGTGSAIFAGGDIGSATATTPAGSDNDTSVATTAWVQTEIGPFLTEAEASALYQRTNAHLTAIAGLSPTNGVLLMYTNGQWRLLQHPAAANKVLTSTTADGGVGWADSTAGSVSDTAYGAGWNGDTTTAPSKNAVYDEMELRAPKASPTFTGTVTLPTVAFGGTTETNWPAMGIRRLWTKVDGVPYWDWVKVDDGLNTASSAGAESGLQGAVNGGALSSADIVPNLPGIKRLRVDSTNDAPYVGWSAFMNCPATGNDVYYGELSLRVRTLSVGTSETMDRIGFFNGASGTNIPNYSAVIVYDTNRVGTAWGFLTSSNSVVGTITASSTTVTADQWVRVGVALYTDRAVGYINGVPFATNTAQLPLGQTIGFGIQKAQVAGTGTASMDTQIDSFELRFYSGR